MKSGLLCLLFHKRSPRLHAFLNKHGSYSRTKTDEILTAILGFLGLSDGLLHSHILHILDRVQSCYSIFETPGIFVFR
jgi:hypothetical protein